MPEIRVLSWDHREQIDFEALTRVLDELGGGRVHVKEADTGDDQYALVFSDSPLTPDEATEAYRQSLEPALPPEPPAYSVVQIGASFFERRFDAAVNWFDVAAQSWLTWEQVCSVGTPTRLVPDPFAEPVPLPWRGRDQVEDCTVEVQERDHDEHVPVSILGIKTIYLDRDDARSMARALIAAADKAESGQP